MITRPMENTDEQNKSQTDYKYIVKYIHSNNDKENNMKRKSYNITQLLKYSPSGPVQIKRCDRDATFQTIADRNTMYRSVMVLFST